MDTSTTCRAPDYAAAVAYALDRLRAELPPELLYHNVVHTEGDVLPAVVRLARMSRIAEADLRLLEVAAAFHDIGQIKGNPGHELLGVETMTQVLPGFGFSPEQIDRVAGMILATRLPQTPHNLEQSLLADADLDSLGRDDFLATSKALWKERAACGMVIPWRDWLASQLRFLSGHRYFSPAARALREAGKLSNIRLLERLLEEGSGPEYASDEADASA